MARIRTIKPEFFSDERLVTVSIAAAYLYAGLWCHVDDAGYMLYSPHRIGSWIFSGRPEAAPNRIRELVGELQGIGRVFLFDLDHRQYLWIPTFERHQRTNHPSMFRNCTRTDPETKKVTPYDLPLLVKRAAPNGQQAGSMFLAERSEHSGSPTGGVPDYSRSPHVALPEPRLGPNGITPLESITSLKHSGSTTGGLPEPYAPVMELKLKEPKSTAESKPLSPTAVSNSSLNQVVNNPDDTGEEPKALPPRLPPYTSIQNLNSNPDGNINELNELTGRIMGLLGIQENKLIYAAVRASIQLKVRNAKVTQKAAAQYIASAAMDANETDRPANWLFWFRDGRYDDPAPKRGTGDAWMQGAKAT